MEDLPNDAKSKEVVRLWRAWRTVHEMVADRVRHLAHDAATELHASPVPCDTSALPETPRTVRSLTLRLGVRTGRGGSQHLAGPFPRRVLQPRWLNKVRLLCKKSFRR
jgi:DNA-directed RNA polymerase I, II, and III subunit RPABC1